MEPMTTTTARNRTDNYFDFNVESENYSDDEASFCVSVDYGTDDPDKQRIPLRYISFDLENRSGAYYVSGQSFDDISHMHCLYIKSQPAHNGTVIASFRLRFWLNTGVTVSDSDTSSVFKATDDNPDDDRINYSELYNNFVVTVESDSREEYHKAYTIISNTSLRSGIDTSAKNAKTLEFKYGYDETYDSIPSGFKKNNLQTSNNEPIYSYYDSSKNKIVVFSESYIYTTGSINTLFNGLEYIEKIEKEITDQFGVIEGLKEQIVKIDVKKAKFEQDLKQVIDNLWDEYEMTPNNTVDYKKPDNIQNTQKEVNRLRNEIRDLGSINIDSIDEYKKAKERYYIY